MTWIRREGGYELYFNRDEQRTRRAASPPTLGESAGVRFLAPTDGDAGGAWLLVNEHGLSIGVLNGYAQGDREGAFASRGRLVLDLAECAATRDVEQHLSQAILERYRSFLLFALEGGGVGSSFAWDGRALEIRPGWPEAEVLVSSGRDPQRARVERRALFERMRAQRGQLDGELLEEFHRSHEPEIGPYSVCMHREDASTVSQSRVSVETRVVRFDYAPGPPCESRPAVTVRLERSNTQPVAGPRESARAPRLAPDP